MDDADQGTWIEAEENPGVWLRVRPITSPAYVTAYALGCLALKRKYGEASIPELELVDLLVRLVHRYILTDWRGLEFDYSAEGAVEMLSDVHFGLLGAVLSCSKRAARTNAPD